MVMGTTARVRIEGGFSLIELMIAVAIVAVLAALAMPLYNQYSMRSVRTAAQGDLLLCQQGLERFASVNFTYVGAANDEGVPSVCSATSPSTGGDPVYNITVSEVDAASWTLLATPIEDGRADGDGVLRLRSNSERAWDQDNDGSYDDDELSWEE